MNPARIYISVPCSIILLLSLSVAPASGGADEFHVEVIPIPRSGTWSGGDWGTIKLTAHDDGSVTGTYNGTYVDEFGKIKLTWNSEKRIWLGQWSEAGIERSGVMYDLELSEDGAKIKGLYKTKILGGRPAKLNFPLHWVWKSE